MKDCRYCDGKGWTAEHDWGPYSHAEDGSCTGSCPVQVPCEHCEGTGKKLAHDKGAQE